LINDYKNKKNAVFTVYPVSKKDLLKDFTFEDIPEKSVYHFHGKNKKKGLNKIKNELCSNIKSGSTSKILLPLTDKKIKAISTYSKQEITNNQSQVHPQQFQQLVENSPSQAREEHQETQTRFRLG